MTITRKRPSEGTHNPSQKSLQRWETEGGAPKGKHPKRPRDPNQLGKFIVDLATGGASEPDPDKGKDPAAMKRGRLGGLKGGRSPAERMTPAERKAAAQRAIKRR